MRVCIECRTDVIPVPVWYTYSKFDHYSEMETEKLALRVYVSKFYTRVRNSGDVLVFARI